jgi:tetratricopeptide (TPR) repeat protein
MLLLGLTCLRATGSESDVIQAVMRGDILDALRIGLARLERDVTTDLNDRAVLGQVLGQALLAVGREEQAEELFQKQLRLYEGLSRAHVRWLASLDRGHLFLSLNKQGRAAEVFNIVADDTEAPTRCSTRPS